MGYIGSHADADDDGSSGDSGDDGSGGGGGNDNLLSWPRHTNQRDISHVATAHCSNTAGSQPFFLFSVSSSGFRRSLYGGRGDQLRLYTGVIPWECTDDFLFQASY